MSDLWTMIWKEVKDQIFQGSRLALIRPLVFIGLLGIVLPAQFGQRWLTSNLAVPILVFFSFFFILNYIGDAIAGEHERHTLETLLASRVSDRAILLGKISVTVAYSWAMVLICLLLGPVVVYLTSGAGVWAFYAPPDVLVDTLVFGLLTSLLATSGGVLVSLHSSTVRQAQQTLLLCTLGLGVALYLGIRALPPELLSSLNPNQILLIILAVLAGLDVILLGIALASFKRSRLILS